MNITTPSIRCRKQDRTSGVPEAFSRRCRSKHRRPATSGRRPVKSKKCRNCGMRPVFCEPDSADGRPEISGRQAKNLRIYGEKSKMSARRHFPQGVYPRVFAYVGETKELWAKYSYVGETKGLETRRIGLTRKPVHPPPPGIPY